MKVTAEVGGAFPADAVTVGPEATGTFTEFDGPPPGDGFTTVIVRLVPGVAVSPGNNAAVNCVADTNVVLRGVPLTCTTADPDDDGGAKLVPATVIDVLPEPTVAGETLLIAGTGLMADTTALDASRTNPLSANRRATHWPPPDAIVNVTVADATPALGGVRLFDRYFQSL